MSKTFQSFAQYNYRLWFTGNIFAASGQWMQRIAQDWLVLTVLTQGGGVQVGIVTALQFLPMLVLSPWAGVLADRINRRHLLQASQAAIALLGLGLGVLILTGHIDLWMVYGFALLGGCVAAFDNPARQAFVSELVPPRMLPNAVALNSTAFNGARLIGPALSGFFIDWVGIGWVFVVNAALFAVPVVTLALMKKDQLDRPARVPRQRGQVREAIQYVRGRRDIILILVIVGTVSLLGLNFQLTSAMMATEVYGLPAGGFGLMSTSLAAGAVVGSLAAARRNNPRLRLIVMAAWLFGLGLTILSLAPTYVWFLVLAVPVGAMSQTLIASANAAVQITTEPAFRGRVMALYSMIFLGVTPFGSPLIGWVAETYGARWSMAVGGISSMAVAMGVAMFGYFHWKIRLQVDYQRHRLHLAIPEAFSPIRGEVAARAHADAAREAAEAEGLTEPGSGQPSGKESGETEQPSWEGGERLSAQTAGRLSDAQLREQARLDEEAEIDDEEAGLK